MFGNRLTRLLRGRKARQAHARRLLAEGQRAEEAGQLQRALERYRQAAGVAPELVTAHVNLGIVLDALARHSEARTAYETALALDPKDAYANYNLANLLYRRGEHARAEPLLLQALHSKPDFFEAMVVLSNVLDAQGAAAAAADMLESALKLRPHASGALLNYGVLLRRLGRGDEAAAALEHSLAASAGERSTIDALEAQNAVLRELGYVLESVAPLRAALALAPERFDLESRLLFALNYDESLPAAEIFARHCDFGARLERAFPPHYAEFRGNRDPLRRLRIGYVSGDFRLHPVAQFARIPIELHDRVAFEVFCYSTSPDNDPVTQHLRSLADHWRDAWGRTDDQLAEQIHEDAIDILIDLSTHTGMFRLATFARRPAPVQASWVGYLNTSGLKQMHYRICDARTDPPGVSDALHTESLVRLPHSQWCYRPYVASVPVHSPPCTANGYLTFGSFNHPGKITTAMCRRWIEVMRQTPASRLVVVGMSSARKRSTVLEAFTDAGISATRLTFVPHVNLDDYARWISTVDIALDTYPYGGGTTTLDALWMGVPVVTATGDTPASRSAASILALLGLQEWIAPGGDRYVRVALDRASDRATLGELRTTLRARLQASPLMDGAGFTRSLETAYRQMWRAWCESPASPRGAGGPIS